MFHPTSLPDGRLGEDAYRFVDWLAAAGQSWWQMLPLGPPDGADSPYRSHSAFAGWRGVLADPDAPVSVDELERLAAREGAWTGEWARYAGEGALADQVRFAREWGALRTYAAERGVRLIGDVPIYVARESADFEARPELFQEGEVAGAPPDPLGPEGQLWGNPLYDWDVHRRQGFRWWIERFRRTFDLVDLARIDHFRGFVAYWAIPEGATTAREGRWRPGPGGDLFHAVRDALGDLPLIAENLGIITPAVERLREELGLPGMHVLHYAFDDGPANPHRPENHEELGVVYTGTHDTDTARGWWDSLGEEERSRTGLDQAEPHWSLVELAWSSRARLAIAPLQDVLGLGSEARMNTPGVAHGNWGWRVDRGALTDELAARLREATAAAARLPEPAVA